jgi:hypothetical protein
MAERTGKIRSYIEGPRWARSDRVIKNLCWDLGLECKVERDTTLFRESIRFEVEGVESKLLAFKQALESAINKF